MTTATMDQAVAEAADHAIGHHPNDAGEIELLGPLDYQCDWVVPAGFMFATATDMAHFVEMLLADGGTTLEPDSARAMLTPQIPAGYPGSSYSFGLGVAQSAEGPVGVGHEGAIAGFQSDIAFIPETGSGVVVIANRFGIDTNQITIRAGYALRGEPIPEELPPPPDYTTDPATWGEYAGTYQSLALGSIQIELRGEELWCTLAVGGFRYNAPLRQAGADMFLFVVDGAPLLAGTFYRDEATGVPRWFVTRAGVGERVAEPTP